MATAKQATQAPQEALQEFMQAFRLNPSYADAKAEFVGRVTERALAAGLPRDP